MSQASEDPRSIEVMLEEIRTLPAHWPGLCRQSAQAAAAAVEALITAGPTAVGALDTVYLVGCGDSYFAGLAAASLVATLSGLRVEAMPALEFCRYALPVASAGSLAVPISFSGEVGRTLECAILARERGLSVLALCGTESSRLARHAPLTMRLSAPTKGLTPGTSSYASLWLACVQLGMALGAARGSQRQDLEAVSDEVSALGAQLAALTSSAAEGARDWAVRLAESKQVTFLGAGPNWATAQFGMAKLMEAAARPASARELEEWAHLEYFVTTPDSEVVICAPAGASLSRAEELWREVEFLGASSTVITQEPERFAGGRRTRVFSLPGEVREPYTPLLCATPLALGAYWLASSLARRSYNFSSPEQEREHYETLHHGLMADGRPLPE